ncbi:hypothetical protein [Mycoplasma struthionis]|uniref:Uncharacterized protein n=1 Tax=Mycoplasma struthionis TaxID=538220 RepID=A0A3G8LG88_9MOLU|nr:hypothetical protein [Mycoplasma struthionis]AZG68521.1 hypothetical protein EGN60_00840 [Mycoplasma struthionis]
MQRFKNVYSDAQNLITSSSDLGQLQKMLSSLTRLNDLTRQLNEEIRTLGVFTKSPLELDSEQLLIQILFNIRVWEKIQKKFPNDKKIKDFVSLMQEIEKHSYHTHYLDFGLQMGDDTYFAYKTQINDLYQPFIAELKKLNVNLQDYLM